MKWLPLYNWAGIASLPSQIMCPKHFTYFILNLPCCQTFFPAKLSKPLSDLSNAHSGCLKKIVIYILYWWHNCLFKQLEWAFKRSERGFEHCMINCIQGFLHSSLTNWRSIILKPEGILVKEIFPKGVKNAVLFLDSGLIGKNPLLSRVTQLKIGDICWRATKVSETVLGVDNAKLGICYMYICMDGWYVCPLNTSVMQFFHPKTRLFRPDTTSFW